MNEKQNGFAFNNRSGKLFTWDFLNSPHDGGNYLIIARSGGGKSINNFIHLAELLAESTADISPPSQNESDGDSNSS